IQQNGYRCMYLGRGSCCSSAFTFCNATAMPEPTAIGRVWDKPMQNDTPTVNASATDAMVVCDNSRGVEIHGTLLRLARHEVSFEIYSASAVVQMSEVIANFSIMEREP